MASISALIPSSSPSFTPLQKPTIITLVSPVLPLPSMSKMGKVRCSMKGKPRSASDDSAKTTEIEGKSSWPELVGEKGEAAKAIIEKENPLVHSIVLSEDSFITFDLRSDRVRVFVNSEGVVVETPIIG